MPINRAFRRAACDTVRAVSPSVPLHPLCIWPDRPSTRVKICKSAFHILYTNIQIAFLCYRVDLYICIKENGRKRRQTKDFFTFRKHRYTDIQILCTFTRRGKGEGRQRTQACRHENRGGRHVRIWAVGGHLAKHLRCAEEKKLLCALRAGGR